MVTMRERDAAGSTLASDGCLIWVCEPTQLPARVTGQVGAPTGVSSWTRGRTCWNVDPPDQKSTAPLPIDLTIHRGANSFTELESV